MQKHSEGFDIKEDCRDPYRLSGKIRFAKAKRPGRDQRQDCF